MEITCFSARELECILAKLLSSVGDQLSASVTNSPSDKGITNFPSKVPWVNVASPPSFTELIINQEKSSLQCQKALTKVVPANNIYWEQPRMTNGIIDDINV